MTTAFDSIGTPALIDEIADAVVTVLKADSTISGWTQKILRVSPAVFGTRPEPWSPPYIMVAALSLTPVQELNTRANYSIPVGMRVVWDETVGELPEGSVTSASLYQHLLSTIINPSNYYLNVPPGNSNLITRIDRFYPVDFAVEDAGNRLVVDMVIEIGYEAEVDLETQAIY